MKEEGRECKGGGKDDVKGRGRKGKAEGRGKGKKM